MPLKEGVDLIVQMAGVPGVGEDTGESLYGSLDRRWSHLRRAQVGMGYGFKFLDNIVTCLAYPRGT
jgi:pantothenate kinase